MTSKSEKHSSASGKSSPKLPKGLEKKQEIEAANLAKRKKEFESEQDTKKKLTCLNWEQTDTTVSIKLLAGKKLSANQIDVEYTHQDVSVSLTDGRKWYCHFHKPIDMSNSKVRLQKMKILLLVIKQESGIHWSNMQFEPDEVTEVTLSPVAPPRRQTAPRPRPNITAARASKDQAKPSDKPEPGGSNSVESMDTTSRTTLGEKLMNTETIGDGPPPPPPLPQTLPGSAKKTEVEKGTTEMQTSKDSSLQNEDVYDLGHIKNDFYEMKAESIVATLCVKEIDKASIKVTFEQREICVQFKTKEVKFLSLHSGTTENTLFQWKITLVDEIVPESCKFKVTDHHVSLTLMKVEARKWGALEASQAKSARVLPTTSDWQPASSSTSKDTSNDDLEDIGLVAKSYTKNYKQNWNESSPSTSGSRSTILDSNKENMSQKPTCMVSPLNKDTESVPVFSIGMTGLDNLGNTCFLNSVVQVLANTKELRDYFTGGMFQKEINHDNPLGSGGKLALAFATLMKILWSGKYRSYAPAKLKNLVGMKNSQFMGFAQHDAQEFMAYLLDGLHEDVNRVRNKPYTSEVDSDGRPDEVVANEAWDRHKSRNDSFIVDLFQGQYKSKLVCPTCGKVSITFDPFMHLSVPLPKKRKRLLQIIFMSRDPFKKPIMYMLRLSKDALVDDLKELVYQKTGVHPVNLRVFESYKNKIHSFLYQGNSLTSVNASDKIFVCEVLSEKLAGEQVLQVPCIQRTVQPVNLPLKCSNCKRECDPGVKLKRCTKCMKTAYCHQACQKQDWLRHRPNCIVSNESVGQPFIISLPKSQATFSRLAQTMEAFSRYSLDVFQPPVSLTGLGATSTAVATSPGLLPDTPTTSTSCTASATITTDPQIPTTDPQIPTTDTQIPATDLEIPTTDLQIHTTDIDMPATDSQMTTSDLPSHQCSTSDSTSPPNIESQSSQATSTMEATLISEANLASEVTSSGSDSSFITVESGPEDSCPIDDNPGSSLSDTTAQKSEDSEFAKFDGFDHDDGLKDSELSPLGSPPTGYVMGRQQDIADHVEPPFSIRPCTKDGKMINGQEGFKLVDKGEEPLDLSEILFLAMDWRNHEKCKPYVLVQSKDLEHDQDESVRTAPAEESNNITLDQCLSLFTEPEVLSPDHAWYCPRCKEHREATKQLSIWRLPAYLIIQLKRFSFSSFIWRDKIDKMVEYPIRGLDLRKHFIGKLPINEPPPIYDLYGVVNHMGGILGGHYMSYARCPDTVDWKRDEIGWRLFDDSMVSLVSENQTMTRSGYVLFYRRRNMMVNLPPSVDELTESSSNDTEDENRTQDSDSYHMGEDNPSHLLTVPLLDNRFIGGGGDATTDDASGDRYNVPSNSPPVYSFTDMDTVD